MEEFKELWDARQSLLFEKFIDTYTKVYTQNKIIRKQKEIARKSKFLHWKYIVYSQILYKLDLSISCGKYMKREKTGRY